LLDFERCRGCVDVFSLEKYKNTLKLKTSITLSEDTLGAIDRILGKSKNRSAFFILHFRRKEHKRLSPKLLVTPARFLQNTLSGIPECREGTDWKMRNNAQIRRFFSCAVLRNTVYSLPKAKYRS
jgi:hypothetical protein